MFINLYVPPAQVITTQCAVSSLPRRTFTCSNGANITGTFIVYIYIFISTACIVSYLIVMCLRFHII